MLQDVNGISPHERFTEDFINYLDKNMEWEESEVGQGGLLVFRRSLKLEHITLTIEGILWHEFNDISSISNNVFTEITIAHL